ncbi:MAG: hypothetical protein ACREC0_15360 [Methylocella sp.]
MNFRERRTRWRAADTPGDAAADPIMDERREVHRWAKINFTAQGNPRG